MQLVLEQSLTSELAGQRRWHGPVAALLVHAGAAVLWLAWPAPVPPPPEEQVIELVLMPQPPAPPPPPVVAPAQPAAQPAAQPMPAPKPVAAAKPAPSRPVLAPAAPAASAGDAVPVASVEPAPAAPPQAPPVEAATEPAPIDMPRPPYPLAARKRGLQGVVTLLVRVGEDGHPLEVALKMSSGHALLDDAAAEAVKRWRFAPARRGGQAIAAAVELPVRFQLDGTG